MLPLLPTLSPDAAILILTAGLVLIAFELNRPGSILPGALGLLLTLMATAGLTEHHPRPEAAVGAIFCAALLLLQLRRKLSAVVVICATIALIFSVANLIPPIPGPHISAWTAVVSGLVIAAGTTVLTRIARRARLNKGLD
jgi:membrane-bound serine protease (ClpP class)